MINPRRKNHLAHNSLARRHKIKRILLATLIGIVGVSFFVFSHAATQTTSIEAEAGNKTPSIKQLSGGTTSNQAIKFTQATNACISGLCMPTGDTVSGGNQWRQIVAEDFTKAAALGSWSQSCDTAVIYTGATGVPWKSYPKCYKDTYQKRPYRADKVLSVHDGTLDFWLHTVDGMPAGANPSPVLPGNTQYQTYGRYEARVKQTTTNLSDYHQAWLLWPQAEADWQCAESDFPESAMSSLTTSAYSHYGCSGSQQAFTSAVFDKTLWHTYTQEWLPGKRNYYIDGLLIGTATNQIYAGPERWQLQTETKSLCDQGTANTCTQDGHLLVDWVTVYAY